MLPVMVGVGVVVNVNCETRGVAGLVDVEGEYPILAPVTATDIAFPRWLVVRVKELPVAPGILTPSCIHW